MSSLTPEQQAALNELVAAMPAGPASPTAGGNGYHPAPARPDLLKTWLGVSAGDLKNQLLAFAAEKDSLQSQLLDWFESNPLDATVEFMLAASWAFFQAEKEENPKIKTFVDAYYYISTCASVGYADIFAVTQTGKLIAGLVMMVGPALTNQVLARPAPRART